MCQRLLTDDALKRIQSSEMTTTPPGLPFVDHVSHQNHLVEVFHWKLGYLILNQLKITRFVKRREYNFFLCTHFRLRASSLSLITTREWSIIGLTIKLCLS